MQSGHEAGLYCDIATLLSCEQWPAAAQLAELAESHLPLICDVKDCDGDKYYKLNERKVMNHLGTSLFLPSCMGVTCKSFQSK